LLCEHCTGEYYLLRAGWKRKSDKAHFDAVSVMPDTTPVKGPVRMIPIDRIDRVPGAGSSPDLVVLKGADLDLSGLTYNKETKAAMRCVGPISIIQMATVLKEKAKRLCIYDQLDLDKEVFLRRCRESDFAIEFPLREERGGDEEGSDVEERRGDDDGDEERSCDESNESDGGGGFVG
jgi:hypothetical protein